MKWKIGHVYETSLVGKSLLVVEPKIHKLVVTDIVTSPHNKQFICIYFNWLECSNEYKHLKYFQHDSVFADSYYWKDIGKYSIIKVLYEN